MVIIANELKRGLAGLGTLSNGVAMTNQYKSGIKVESVTKEHYQPNFITSSGHLFASINFKVLHVSAEFTVHKLSLAQQFLP